MGAGPRGHPVPAPRGFGPVHGGPRGRRDGPQYEAPFLVIDSMTPAGKCIKTKQTKTRRGRAPRLPVPLRRVAWDVRAAAASAVAAWRDTSMIPHARASLIKSSNGMTIFTRRTAPQAQLNDRCVIPWPDVAASCRWHDRVPRPRGLRGTRPPQLPIHVWSRRLLSFVSLQSQ